MTSSPMTRDLDDDDLMDEAGERRSYILGLAWALVLTVAAFAVVWLDVLQGRHALLGLGALAVIQIIVHFRCFLHVQVAKSHQDDLRLILFTTLIVIIIVAGTVWILWDQHARMMG